MLTALAEAGWIGDEINANPEEFACRPKSVIPLTVMCQGLLA